MKKLQLVKVKGDPFDHLFGLIDYDRWYVIHEDGSREQVEIEIQVEENP